MKVIFITREGYNLSGARVRCYNFARELRKYGVDTQIFSYGDDLGAKYGEKEFEMALTQKIKYNLKAFKILLKKEKDRIIFMQRLNYHSLTPFLVSLLKRNKFIFDCDDWNIREDPKYYLGIYPSSKMEYLTRRIAKYANICIAASRFLEDYLLRFNKRTYYLPTAVDTETFKPSSQTPDASRLTFSWIGTVYHKDMFLNLAFIIECFSLLSKKYSNIYLEIVGEGRYIEEIKRKLIGNNRIKIKDWIPPLKIPEYLARVDIGLLPLIQNTRFNRAKSPTKLFEYMSMGRPVVSSDIGEAAHIIEDGENGFLTKTKEEFIEKMQKLIQDANLRQRIGEKARKTVEKHYSVEILGKRLYEILNKI